MVTLSINDKCELVANHILTEEHYTEEVLNSILEPCNTVIDKSEDNIYLEFLLSPEIKDPKNTLRVSRNKDYYVHSLEKDGLYVYYMIKTIDQTKINKDYTGLYFNTNDLNIYFNNQIINDLKFLVDILSTLNEGEGLLHYEKEEIFSICKLKKCLIELQKKAITSYKSNSCKNINPERQNRDFLFISIYILENLICNERYTEATEIIKSIESCGIGCTISTNKSKCNCG